jgi:dihydrofolate reductase
VNADTKSGKGAHQRVVIIAAVARNGVIGDGEGMPWRLPSDMRRFRKLTMGKPIVMGRRTFETIGKPLEGRLNIVVSRSRPSVPEGVVVAADVDAALTVAGREAGADAVMVIGGGEIYHRLIDRADALFITHVAAEPAGHVTFPAIDPGIWRAVSREAVAADPKDSAASEFVVYERAANP